MRICKLEEIIPGGLVGQCCASLHRDMAVMLVVISSPKNWRISTNGLAALCYVAFALPEYIDSGRDRVGMSGVRQMDDSWR